ncbi:hypothetical protein Y032_0460g1856 [Ancylostoma ceylanicum]|uniref:Uncharacterized protein n=1 Tax=Ancylostoma ceylanicum TaxID=53326 RepID=A0A016WZL2_9BILA|nr:hypothetical protein Y032_0460g1856 [Ancylostoma ceylanicum]
MPDATTAALSGDDVAEGAAGAAEEQQEVLTAAVGGAAEIASGRDERSTGFFHARTNLQLEVSATPRPRRVERREMKIGERHPRRSWIPHGRPKRFPHLPDSQQVQPGTT